MNQQLKLLPPVTTGDNVISLLPRLNKLATRLTQQLGDVIDGKIYNSGVSVPRPRVN